MDELREKVANRIFATGMLREREGGDAALWEAALKMTDFVLELPEIAGALAYREAARKQGMALNDGQIGVEYKPRNLGPSISTNKRTPV